jgi:methylated-DNA-[protein]-cysteine S-methyltransferase
MAASGFALFDTPLGACGIAWSEAGLAGVLLPAAWPGATRASLARRFAGAREAAPPAPIGHAIERVVALLEGARDDLAAIALDWDGVADFDRRVYEAARGIVPGRTSTYGELAARIGEPDAARAVGRSLAANRFAIVVPCHRVLGAGGRAGGFSAPGGLRTKLRLLEIERARFGTAAGLFDDAATLR